MRIGRGEMRNLKGAEGETGCHKTRGVFGVLYVLYEEYYVVVMGYPEPCRGLSPWKLREQKYQVRQIESFFSVPKLKLSTNSGLIIGECCLSLTHM